MWKWCATNPDEINIVVKNLNRFPTPNLGIGNLLKDCTTMLTTQVHLPVYSLRLSHTVMKKVYDQPQTISQRSLNCEFKAKQVSGKPKVAFTLKFLFFSLSNNLFFTFVLWNSLKNGSRDLYRVKGAVQAHSLTKLSLLAQSKLYPATSSLVQAER